MRHFNLRSLSPRQQRFGARSSTVFLAGRSRHRPRLEVMEDRTLLSTFLVNTTADDGPGSLRQAILDSNVENSGTNTIDFVIPGQGAQTITPASPLPTITTAVLIDGYSQPGASPNSDAEDDNALIQVVLSGYPAVYFGDGLAIDAPGVSVRGLAIYGFGSNIHLLDPNGEDTIAGNFIGLDASGTGEYNIHAGIFIDNSGPNTIGGTSLADRNIISSNYYVGVDLDGVGSSGNAIDGNFIGTDASGTAPASGYGYGSGIALFDGASGNLIGGTSLGAGNVISGNPGNGVLIAESIPASTGNLIQGNLIGTDATGKLALGNRQSGVEIDSSSENTVGGTVAGAGNVVADNLGSGIVSAYGSIDNRLNANRIFANGGPAIDRTANSTAPRSGPNALQNSPVVVKTDLGQLEGGLAGGIPNATFHIDIFASSSYGPGGAGEAEDYLGSLDVTTDSNGDAAFDVPFAVPAGLPILTATATDPAGSTSEISPIRPATFAAPIGRDMSSRNSHLTSRSARAMDSPWTTRMPRRWIPCGASHFQSCPEYSFFLVRMD